MKKVALILLVGLAACGQDLKPRVDKLEKENALLKEMTAPLPSSLDNYFPPKAQGPVYLMEMFSLSNPFEGIGIDLQEKDLPGAKANFDAFRAQYLKMSVMVPEWKEKFPVGPVDSLGLAMGSGNPAMIGSAMGRIGRLCASCHVINQIRAQQKYSWPDFEALSLTDPITNQNISWHESMMRIANAFTAIGNDLGQGQIENVRTNFKSFSDRFISLSANCSGCHDTPRSYFVSQNVQGMVSDLGKAVAATPPDGKAIGQLLGAIGNESCMKCHLVHMPSATAKSFWKAYPGMIR